ncbi:nucleoid-associated protein [Chitinibacter tainanensis]|uniref:nucleoid-associated protein n=1 Tax=Chitinibacter tainanensis TaxID=230667 RepID=UPI002356BC84|nr:nucleoid-associated protein [Chitinibacter tainanensis]
MSLNTIEHLIIHQLHKEPSGPARVALAPAALAITPAAQRLVDQLCEQYGTRNGKGFGQFADDETLLMPQLVRRFSQENSLDFTGFSRELMAELQTRMEAEPLASGGYVLVAQVNNAAMRFIFIALLSEVIGTAVNDELQVIDSIHLDMQHLRVAGRIDLGSWQAGGERYVSFLRGRGDVAGYFKQFLGCLDVKTPLKETQKLVKGLEAFANEQAIAGDERDELFQRAHSYLDALGEGQGEVALATVAEQVFPTAPAQLQAALENEELGINDGFVPDRRAIKPLMRFKANAPQWKVEFDRASLRSGAVIYDKYSDTLVLSNVPEELKQALLAQ